MSISLKELRKIERECRAEAHAIIQQEYATYDDIWYGRIRLDAVLEEYGKDVVKDLIRIMPNLLVRNKTSCPIDLVADRYGFESISALIDYLLAYTPRGPKEERLYETLLAERLMAHIAGQEVHEVSLVDEVPF
ncbi:MAG: iron receptor [Desulfovibrio sp.]|nr:iron receptor [Desulfovibrio sp.]